MSMINEQYLVNVIDLYRRMSMIVSIVNDFSQNDTLRQELLESITVGQYLDMIKFVQGLEEHGIKEFIQTN